MRVLDTVLLLHAGNHVIRVHEDSDDEHREHPIHGCCIHPIKGV